MAKREYLRVLMGASDEVLAEFEVSFWWHVGDIEAVTEEQWQDHLDEAARQAVQELFGGAEQAS
jgi:hypothetical protein